MKTTARVVKRYHPMIEKSAIENGWLSPLNDFLTFIRPLVFDKYLTQKSSGNTNRDLTIMTISDFNKYLSEYKDKAKLLKMFNTHKNAKWLTKEASYRLAKLVIRLLAWECHKVVFDLNDAMLSTLKVVAANNAKTSGRINLPKYPCVFINLSTPINLCQTSSKKIQSFSGLYIHYHDLTEKFMGKQSGTSRLLDKDGNVTKYLYPINVAFTYVSSTGDELLAGSKSPYSLQLQDKILDQISDEDDILIKAVLTYLSTEQKYVEVVDTPPIIRRIKRYRYPFGGVPVAPEIVYVGKRFTGVLKRYPKKPMIRFNSAKKTPHMRKAHWHGYWVGNRNEKKVKVLRWISPVLVNTEDIQDIPTKIVRCI